MPRFRLRTLRFRSPRSPSLLVLPLVALLGCTEAEPPTGPEAPPALGVTTAATLVFRQVSEGQFYSCGVTTTDVAYCWGHNNYGQLGDGTNTRRNRPVPVAGGLRFRQVVVGIAHTCYRCLFRPFPSQV